METFRDIIDLWESPGAMAADTGRNTEAIHKWRQRNSIPVDSWIVVRDAARRRKYSGVTLERMARLAARVTV